MRAPAREAAPSRGLAVASRLEDLLLQTEIRGAVISLPSYWGQLKDADRAVRAELQGWADETWPTVEPCACGCSAVPRKEVVTGSVQLWWYLIPFLYGTGTAPVVERSTQR